LGARVEMRNLKRNQQKIYYKSYEGKRDIIDDNGFETGESEPIYSEPIEVMISISASKGEATEQQFGTNIDYDKVMITFDKSVKIDEYSKLYVDVIEESNGVITDGMEPDYIVKKVAKSLNSISYAIQKVN
jgi:hypothetical protein